MDTFCIVFKSIGDGVLALIGIVVAIDILLPSFHKWLEEKEGVVKNNRPLTICMGVCLGAFCVVYIGVSIRSGIIQVKEHSPLYQAQMLAQEAAYSRQMEIKEHILNFCPDLKEYANQCAKGDTADGTIFRCSCRNSLQTSHRKIIRRINPALANSSAWRSQTES
jgi:hypothetical protein